MKKALGFLLLAVVIVLAILVFRASTVFEDHQIQALEDIVEINLDRDQAIGRFSRALQFPTISYDDRNNFDAGAFTDFHDFLQSAYPLVHRHARRTVVNDYSLVFHLEGRDPSL